MGLQGKLTSNSSTSPPGLGPDLVRERYGFAINSEIQKSIIMNVNISILLLSLFQLLLPSNYDFGH